MHYIKSTIFFISCLCLAWSGLAAQSDYYWSMDQKLELTVDQSLASITFDNPADAMALSDFDRPGFSLDIFSYDGRVIVELPQKVSTPEDVLMLMGLSDRGIKSVTFGRRLSDGFPIYPLHMVNAHLADGVQLSDLEETLRKFGASYSTENRLWITFDLEDIELVLPMANHLQESGLAEWATPDFYAELETFNDPLYGSQYQLNNTGQTVGGDQGVADIDCDAPEAWGITKGSNGITVAVLDQGIEAHPDINGIDAGYTPLDNGDGTPDGTANAHGMACAGIIVANHNNIGVRGIAPNVRLRGVNIFKGGGTSARVASGITWASGNSDVLSNSYGWSSCTASFANVEAAISDAVTNGRNGLGCVLVFSAGNSYQGCLNYPASNPNVISVSAMSNAGVLHNYSSYGPGLTISAPSGGIPGNVYTTDRPGANGYTSGDYTTTFNGTSAACPVVSGAAALVLSVNSSLTEAEVQQILENTATDMGSSGYDVEFGHGRVNAHQAVLQAQGGSNQSPNVSFNTPTNGQTFSAGANVYVRVNASDNDGSISNVKLYLNNAFVRQENFAPYEWGASGQNDPELQNMSPGTYSLRAVATDNDGATSQTTITITVSGGGSNQVPSMSFQTPSDGQTFSEGDNIYVRVNATDSDGSISNVKLYKNGAFVRQENSAPYEWGGSGQNDPLLQNLSPGTIFLRARATDNDGATTDETIVITVNAASGGTNVVQVRARTVGSAGGTARMRVRLMSGTNHTGNNSPVQTRTFNPPKGSWTTYTATFNQNVSADRIRVEFDNDTGGRDLDVDWIRIDGTTFQSENSDTWATGTWTSNGGCNDAFKQQQRIHCNGFFHYDTDSDNAPNANDGDGTISTNELENEGMRTLSQNLDPFPNPFSGPLNIPAIEDIPEGTVIELSLISIHGQQVYREVFTNTLSIHTIRPEIPAGIYMLLIHSEDYVYQKKVIRH